MTREQAKKAVTDARHIHFVGIGGVSMSGLAKIAKRRGYQVSGSDIQNSAVIEDLETQGIEVDIPHQIRAIEQADLVVHTAAVHEDNVELCYAKERQLPILERAVLLGLLMDQFEQSVAISGTHGKTTATGMLSTILMEVGMDPTVLIGGELPCIQGNVRIGESNCLISEACEYVDSFLQFFPSIAVILNIEEDHLDYFSGIEQIRRSFAQFASQSTNRIIACGQDENVRLALQQENPLFYGIGVDFPFGAREVSYEGGCRYELWKQGEYICPVSLSVSGEHNVKNSLAALACADALGVELSKAAAALQAFGGVKRRFEKKGIREGVLVYDDYAHHPSEIRATLQAVKHLDYQTLWCIFQPHTYTRTKALLDDFAAVLSDAGQVIITDIYAAREPDTGVVHARDLAEKIPNACYLKEFSEVVAFLKQNVSCGDLVLTVGAGTVWQIGELFLNI